MLIQKWQMIMLLGCKNASSLKAKMSMRIQLIRQGYYHDQIIVSLFGMYCGIDEHGNN